MFRVTPQQQLFHMLQDDEQRDYMAAQLRHIKPASQDLLCTALVAHLRWHVTEHFDDPWLQQHFDLMRSHLNLNQSN